MATTSPHALPTGTVSFLFTDIEGSTRLVESLGGSWVEVLGRHNTILGRAVAEASGSLIGSEGDSLFAVFFDASAAVAAAVGGQLGIASEPWPRNHEVRVRMGIHTGEATLVGRDYVGLDVHRASRIADAAHGGQIVVSESTAVSVETQLPEGASLLDLGKYRLRDLSQPEALFQVTVDGLTHEFPPLRTLDFIPNNLPPQLTSFVGRDTELATALELLHATRVLTLIGPGGTGKTRLSLQIAAEAGDRFDDGVFFVGLSPVSDVEVVPSAILAALGLSGSSREQTPEARLLNELQSKSLLLVLDNFEQLLEAAPLVSRMVASSPRSQFVVTSRAPLQISGEQQLPVPPLGTAVAATVDEALAIEGVQLLVDRAMSVRPEFSVTNENVAAVVQLVTMLDGLPLAIELVASRLRLLPVETVLDRLDSKMLSSGSVDAPPRQQTITNAISWSYELLDPAQQRLFARLSVFSGGARLDEIEAMCADWGVGIDVIDGLETLANQSLLASVTASSSPRFRMLHVIREFAMDRLAETDEASATHEAHLRVYTELVEQAAPQLLGEDRVHWFDLLDADHDNLRTALEWGVANKRTDLVLRLAASSWRFWQARGHLHEAQRRLEQALSMPEGDDQYRAKALEALGGVHWWRGELDRCLVLYEEALVMQRALGDERELANALYNYGLAVGFYLNEFDRSREILTEARGIYEALYDEDGLGDVAWGMGNTHLAQNDPTALDDFKRAVGHYRKSGNEFGEGWSAFEVGAYYERNGSYKQAWPYLSEAMQLFGSHKDVSGVVMVGSEMASLALGLGDRSRAYRLAGMVDTLRISSGTDLVGFGFNIREGLEPETLQDLKGRDLASFEDGRRADYTRLVEYALTGPTEFDT